MKNNDRKGEIARNEQFLPLPQCFSFYRIDELQSILTKSEIVVCKLFRFLVFNCFKSRLAHLIVYA